MMEVKLKEDTFVYLKIEIRKPNRNRKPFLSGQLYLELKQLDEEKVKGDVRRAKSKAESTEKGNKNSLLSHIRRSERERQHCSFTFVFRVYQGYSEVA